MAHTAPLVLRLLASSVRAATRAGKIIRDVMSRGDLGIIDKGKNDLQTEADRSAQRCIVVSLSQQYPNLTIIGEEGTSNTEVPSDWVVTDCDQSVLSMQCPQEYVHVAVKDIVVWVDPLDGTAEYAQGFLEHVTVLIGLSVKGRAIGGVIHQPYFNLQNEPETIGRTIWGLIGLGVGGCRPTNPPENKLIITTTKSHSNALTQETLDALHPDEVIRVSGAGHKVLLLLDGRAHAYVFASKGCKKWDTCGPEAVLMASGGKLTDIHGNFYNYDETASYPNTGGTLATAKGTDHAGLVSKIPQSVRDHLV